MQLKQRLTFLCILPFIVLYTHAQMENNGITVRLNHQLLDFSRIDDPGFSTGKIGDFLNDRGRKYLQSEMYQFLENFSFTKIFDNLKTADSISISQNGDEISIPPFWATFHVKVPGNLSVKKVLASLNNAYPLVIYAHYNYPGEFLGIPNDSLFSNQHSLQSGTYPNGHIYMDSAWNMETGKRHIKVGVFDSGIDTTHPDLKSQVLIGHGYNLEVDTYSTSWGTDVTGSHGHGTSVAGIIGAKRNNSIGTSGIAGGDGTNASGVSLIDFRLSPGLHAENISKAVIDAARSVGSYYDWSLNGSNPNEDSYWSNASGYGIHVGNNSFTIKIANTSQIDTLGGNKQINDTTVVGWPDDPTPQDCLLCREAYLFSLKNGVVMVAASGNGYYPTGGGSPSSYYTPSNAFPQNYDDSWIINVGGAGTNGEWFDGSNGLSYENFWYAEIHKDLDIIAPATQAMIYTTASVFAQDSISRYAKFSGTSAAAPHAAGVAALLLSKYNQNCYTNSNLDMADVEYILEHSARDVRTVGPDHYTGYGLLDAHKALKMIDFPKYQIIHPDITPNSVTETASDTITLYLNKPLFSGGHGPIDSNFPLQLSSYYRVIRKEIKTTYNFSSYIFPSTQILAYWTRPSQTNSLRRIEDTLTYNDPISGLIITSDTFKIEPNAEIISFNPSGNLTLKGYYYHFIGLYDSPYNFYGNLQGQDYWYPVNPSLQLPRMAYSIYLKDSLASLYTFSCDSLNPLVDTLLNLSPNISSNPLFLYPNPSNGILKIGSIQNNFNLKSIEIFGVNGVLSEQRFLSGEAPSASYEFNFGELANGLYTLVLITDDNKRYIKKWSKL